MDNSDDMEIDQPLNHPNDDEEAEEKIDDSFLCCVCLDLLYKPVVLACGHISCFWCVDRAMNGGGESHCPICRFPYSHFPSICQLLHFLLLKAYPITYNRRDRQMLEEEEKDDCFSPQLGDILSNSDSCKEVKFQVSPSTSSTICSLTISCTDTSSSGNMKSSILKKPYQGSPSEISGGTYASLEAMQTLSIEGNNSPGNNLKGGFCELVSVSDILCVACRQLLFRPVVLNCGHVYCESCITIPVDETLRCQLCQSPHPKGCPKVCLELHHFLERRFSKEYALRNESVQRLPIQCQQGSPSVCANHDGKQGAPSLYSPTQSLSYTDRRLNVHFRVGCDYCGMYPIVGDRYRCKDCVEKIGFDLCSECYNNTCSELPGRFNQQHTAEHEFEFIQANMMQSFMLRMAFEYSEDGSTVPILSDDVSEDPEDGYAAPEDPEGGGHFS